MVLKYYLLAVCYTYFATCCVLLATCYLLLTTFAPFFIGDYILSADVLEPSVDVPGLNAVGYALTIYDHILTLAMLTIPMCSASAWCSAMLTRWAAGYVAECAPTATVSSSNTSSAALN